MYRCNFFKNNHNQKLKITDFQTHVNILSDIVNILNILFDNIYVALIYN